MPRLQTLKTNLTRLESRQAQAMPVVERKRGRAGVADRDRVRERDNGLCQECKRKGKATSATIVDHIFPLHLSGSDHDSNKQLLCKPCHDKKSKQEGAARSSGDAWLR